MLNRVPSSSVDVTSMSPDVGDLHNHGNVVDNKWITIHDTDVDGSATP